MSLLIKIDIRNDFYQPSKYCTFYKFYQTHCKKEIEKQYGDLYKNVDSKIIEKTTKEKELQCLKYFRKTYHVPYEDKDIVYDEEDLPKILKIIYKD